MEVLERLFAKGGPHHLILAGNPRVIALVRARLPRHIEEKLVGAAPVVGDGTTLSRFAEFEQTESLETANLLLDELRTGGLAVAGTEAALDSANVASRGRISGKSWYRPPSDPVAQWKSCAAATSCSRSEESAAGSGT